MAVRRWTIAACLAAISYLLMFISFVIIPIVPFMKVDFSDIPILLAFFILGPLGGIEVALLRSVLYFIISGPTIPNLIGVSLSLLASLVFCLPFYYLMARHTISLKRCLIATLGATLTLTLVLSLVNWLVTLPLYMSLLGMKLSLPLNQLILWGVIPFNLIKGCLLSVVFCLVYYKLNHWLKQKNYLSM